MEPMLLGSPVSPVAGVSTATPTTVAPYLPSYLLGETQHSMSNSRVAVPGSSPGRHFPAGGPGQQSSPASPAVGSTFTTPRFGRGDRASGPPVLGLGSPATPLQHRSPFPSTDLYRTATRTPMGSPHTTSLRPLSTPHPNSPYHHHNQQHSALNASIISTETHSDVASSGFSPLEEWVTVFGFPVASASYILTQFAQLGTIADQRMPGSGNWMHLKYQTPLQARKALALNGKIFASNIMIGVVPCTDKTLLSDNKENHRVLANTSYMSPGLINTSIVPGDSGSYMSTPKANIRSLISQTTPAENQVVPSANTPKKNDSFIAKAMQHILGV